MRYTYYGDADFNGIVNFDDYSQIDNGFNNAGTDWYHGDFDLTGAVNFDDYSLIDHAFNIGGGAMMTTGPGDGNPNLMALGQMPHFTQSFMYYFIDWNIEHNDTYYTPEDFFPDGVPW